MIRRPATAKINLALVVGATRPDGKHEVATILQRLDLADRVALRPASGLEVLRQAGDVWAWDHDEPGQQRSSLDRPQEHRWRKLVDHG